MIAVPDKEYRFDSRWIVTTIIAVVALILSIYQIWLQQNQQKVNSAVDLSKTYFQNDESRRAQAIILRTKAPMVYSEEWLRERTLVDFNDYVAALVNEGLINNSFVSSRIKCDIRWIYETTRVRRKDLASSAIQIVKYVEAGFDRGCPELH